MTTSLYWEPIVDNEKPLKGDDTNLKWKLRKHYGDPVDITLDKHDMSYLEGLRDGEVEGAQELIDLIEQYDAIRLIERR